MGNVFDDSIKPIHEAVFFLDNYNKRQLDEYRARYPELEAQLRPGVVCGEPSKGQTDHTQNYLIAKAEVMTSALQEAAHATKSASQAVARRIKWIRRIQVCLDVLVLLGSSSVIGSLTLAGGDSDVATVAAIITLFSGCCSLLVNHASKLLNPQFGNIFDAYQNLHQLSWQAQSLAQEISLSVQYQKMGNHLSSLVAQGNGLMAEVNKWAAQLFHDPQ